MKKTWLIKILLLLAYSIPYVFLSINGDAKMGTMLFYIIMIMGLSILCMSAIKTKNIAIIYIGNIISFISSYITAKAVNLEDMGWYFKPFTSYSLIITISIVVAIIETIIIAIHLGKTRNKTEV